MTRDQEIKGIILNLTRDELQEFIAQTDRLLWIEYNVLDRVSDENAPRASWIDTTWPERAERLVLRTIVERHVDLAMAAI